MNILGFMNFDHGKINACFFDNYLIGIQLWNL